MKVKSKEYQENEIFLKLHKYIEFYQSFSILIMSFYTNGTKAIGNIDSSIYSSMSGTLDSIKMVLQNGRINDSYALLRKFHDSAIMNVYINLYLEDNLSIDNFIVDKIQNWLQGKEQLPNFRTMTNYIKDAKQTSHLYSLLNSDDRYDKIRDTCNNNAHYNFYRNVMLNDNEVYNEHRGSYLKLLSSDLTQIILLHLTYIFYCKPNYMASSDYTDHLECGMTPPHDSQYWVANLIQEIFDTVIKKHRPDIAAEIKGSSAMHIE